MWSAIRSALMIFNVQILFQTPIDTVPKTTENGTVKTELILWNVGQGQWATVSTREACFHFDMGGEKIDWPSVQSVCKDKSNLAFFSHWDNDHLSFAYSASRNLPHFCVAAQPRGPCPSFSKYKLLKRLPVCEDFHNNKIEEIYKLSSQFPSNPTSNDFSRVFEYAHWLLAQGDSPKREEKLWSKNIKFPEEIRVIVLGHHGSHTSSSANLLSTLPHLKIALASARIARYGHPHADTLARLKTFGVSCLRTEEWGNIHVEMPPPP